MTTEYLLPSVVQYIGKELKGRHLDHRPEAERDSNFGWMKAGKLRVWENDAVYWDPMVHLLSVNCEHMLNPTVAFVPLVSYGCWKKSLSELSVSSKVG